LKGTKVITYHRSWSYFVQRYGMEVAGEIEPKPGIAPTPGHLAKLVRLIEEQNVPIIIKEHYFSNRYPKFLSDKTGIKVLTLPNMSGGSPDVEGYFNFIDHNIKALLRALGKPVLSQEAIEKELQKAGA
jgi:ABC-type Zn uptake system ZnuABC Zn-binding protein ZnuA